MTSGVTATVLAAVVRAAGSAVSAKPGSAPGGPGPGGVGLGWMVPGGMVPGGVAPGGMGPTEGPPAVLSRAGPSAEGWMAAGVLPGGLSPGGFLPSGPGVGWAVLGFGLGMLAGAVGRVLLGRLQRGTQVAPPWLEVAVGVPWAFVVGTAGSGVLPWSWVPLLLGAGWLAMVAGVVDLRHHRLPDALTLPALPAALLLTAPLGIAAVGRAAAGAALLAGMYLLVHGVSPRSLGLGDVKLAAPVGAMLTAASWPALLLGCALTAVVSAGVAGFLVARSVRRSRDDGVPVAGPGPAGPGPLALGPLALGPLALGPLALGPLALGPLALGPSALGPAGPGLAGVGPGPAAPGPVAPGASAGSVGAAAWRSGARRVAPPSGRPAELPLGPPMLGSAWVVVFVAALVGA